MWKIFAISLLLIPSLSFAQLKVGKPLPEVSISDKQGGLVVGGAWSSNRIKGKVTTLMYVDPDEKTLNEHVEQALKKENFPRDKFHSIAVVNTAATWKPDSMIKSVLKNKQQEFPDSEYVMDRNKVLVKEWGLGDDTYHILLFGKDGSVLYEKKGALNTQEVQKLIRLVRENL